MSHHIPENANTLKVGIRLWPATTSNWFMNSDATMQFTLFSKRVLRRRQVRTGRICLGARNTKCMEERSDGQHISFSATGRERKMSDGQFWGLLAFALNSCSINFEQSLIILSGTVSLRCYINKSFAIRSLNVWLMTPKVGRCFAYLKFWLVLTRRRSYTPLKHSQKQPWIPVLQNIAR